MKKKEVHVELFGGETQLFEEKMLKIKIYHMLTLKICRKCTHSALTPFFEPTLSRCGFPNGFLLALARKPPSVRNDRMFENTIGVHQNPIFEPMYRKDTRMDF